MKQNSSRGMAFLPLSGSTKCHARSHRVQLDSGERDPIGSGKGQKRGHLS